MKDQAREGVITVKKPVYSGLFVYGMDDALFTQTVEMVMQGGASEVSLFPDGAMPPDKWRTFRNIIESKG